LTFITLILHSGKSRITISGYCLVVILRHVTFPSSAPVEYRDKLTLLLIPQSFFILRFNLCTWYTIVKQQSFLGCLTTLFQLHGLCRVEWGDKGDQYIIFWNMSVVAQHTHSPRSTEEKQLKNSSEKSVTSLSINACSLRKELRTRYR
jgi:hypothetical protein